MGFRTEKTITGANQWTDPIIVDGDALVYCTGTLDGYLEVQLLSC